MSPNQLNQPNFQRAQYSGQPVSLDHCTFCSRAIDGEFYRTNGDLTCPICAAHLQSALPIPTRKTYWRSAGYGLVVAAGASLAYLLLLRFMARLGTADFAPLAAIPVGYAIGRAMQCAGSSARGRRFQLTGAFLTYAAVALASTAGVLSMRGLPLYAYPVLVFGPLLMLITGHSQTALYLLFFIAFGIRWAWTLLQPHGIKITGPETQPPTPPKPQTQKKK
ncbi:MAG: hypothetical protein WB439_00270, partial [Acidobacteriaceae bacterium]